MIVDKQETKYTLPSILDLDDLFSRTPNTTVLTEIMLDRTPEEIAEILCDISSDRSDSVAICSCGEMTGNYYDGMKCPTCGTVCVSTLFGEIRNDTWLEIPVSIKAVLNPHVFRILAKWMGNVKGLKTKHPILRSILNMQLPKEPILGTPFSTSMGFNWFYDNFNAVMDYFLSSHPTPSGRAQSKSMALFLARCGKAIWCTKLPILSKIIQPITKASKEIRYADADIKNLFKSIITLRSVLLAEKMMKFTTDHVDRNFFRVYSEFLAYTDNILNLKLPKKPSVLRKHVFGSRSHCSARTVAIPITEPHDIDEVYLPWKLGLMMYKYHIIKILTSKLNMTVFKAFDRVMEAVNIYDHEIDLIMQGMIKDCKYKGLPILMNRNPSLQIGAIQLLFVTRVKPNLKSNPFPAIIDDTPSFISLESNQHDDDLDDDYSGDIFGESEYRDQALIDKITSYVEDGAIAVSPCIVKGPNLDFDGDEINIMPLFEMDEVPKYNRFHPAHRFISPDELKCAGGDVTLSSQQFCILSGWVNDDITPG